jgi:hypothetical protein
MQQQTVKTAEQASRETLLAIQTANPIEAMAYEQLALRRLAELGVPPLHPPAPPNHTAAPTTASAGGVGAMFSTRRALVLALKRMISLFSPVDLVRQVGPGMRPLPRHEWERSKWGGPPRTGIY